MIGVVKYLLGTFKNLFNPGVSLFAKIDYKSIISHKAKIYGFVQVYDSTMKEYSYAGRKTHIICSDIGKFCSIASEVKIGMGEHTLKNISTSPIFTEKNNSTGHKWTTNTNVYPFQRVKIGNDVWIGTRVMILGGVTIGDGAVIGAGSIVTKDVEPYSIVAGVPAKLIRYRFSKDQIELLNQTLWWDKSVEVLKENLSLFQGNDNMDERIRILHKL